jgi:hypothetical protein
MEVRDYGLSDPKMLEHSGTMRLVFIDDQADFVALDPDLDTPFEDDWRDSINDSFNVDTDELRDDIQGEKTERVKEKMKQSSLAYRDLKYFVLKAFPNNKKTQERFGLDNYGDVNQSQARMAMLLKDMHKEATDPVLGPALLAAGYTPAKVAMLDTLFNELNNENWDQNKFITNSPEATEARIKQYNSTWAFMAKVNAASKVVYAEDVVKRNKYTLPVTNNTTDQFNVVGQMVNSATGDPIEGGKAKIVELGLIVLSDEFGAFGFEAIAQGNYTIQYSADGFQDVSNPLVVPASGVVTANISMTPNP